MRDLAANLKWDGSTLHVAAAEIDPKNEIIIMVLCYVVVWFAGHSSMCPTWKNTCNVVIVELYFEY